VCFLHELNHLPVSDEIPLCVGGVGGEAAGDRQLAKENKEKTVKNLKKENK
jgi:hypothetical protein